ncbi:hypothetical protein J8L88_16835 [Aquimarina sp. MMG015]|uniref:hypothetical protein n=1 Tax=Aquimarina sp. MMG015 TaxID=2822689 RepID=UPI001B3A0582|nr:hypothetical protein [Aquimarina sp. MMG015]MBQ4804529.1 hypothetical protein [Aquimarina sp. MMG015]
MKKVTKNNLVLNLKEATSTLLEMVRSSCWNEISDNTVYIISEIGKDLQNRTERKKENNGKEPKSLNEITTELKTIYENLYDINLHIYKSKKKKTIIEIQYYPKSSLELDFYETVRDDEPMLHCKIGIPSYRKNDSEQFDVNWELGGIRHEWNSFLGKMRFKTWEYNYNKNKKLKNKNVG